MKLRGRCAIVTGGSQGLGLEIARTLLRDGADVMIAARQADTLEAAGRELLDLRVHPEQRVVWQTADVSKPDDVKRLVQRTVAELGQVDVLICNAGVYGPIGRVEDLDWDAWVSAIEINLYGTVLCCREVVPLMRQQGRGRIVFLSGGGATAPLPRFSAYAASKVAVVRFAETLSEELQGTGITVNAIAPGALNTRLLDKVLEAGAERAGEDFYARMVRQSSEGGVPLETGAELVAFLASDESGGVTGRLLAAVWDDWRGLPAQQEQLARSDVFTLRRIVPSDRGWEVP